jgi:hypothetical protein
LHEAVSKGEDCMLKLVAKHRDAPVLQVVQMVNMGRLFLNMYMYALATTVLQR